MVVFLRHILTLSPPHPPSVTVKKEPQAAVKLQTPPGGFPLAPPPGFPAKQPQPQAAATVIGGTSTSRPQLVPPVLAAARAAMAASTSQQGQQAGAQGGDMKPAFQFDTPSPDDYVLAAQQGRPLPGMCGQHV